MNRIKKILIANRGEIAIRIMRGATELGIKTVAIYSHEDRLALHRFKADESYLVGEGLGPVKAYLAGDDILRIAKSVGADAIHPGYGFLSEDPEFADACREAGIKFIGPEGQAMRDLGNKVGARNIAIKAGVPVIPATDPLPKDMDKVRELADKIGYPIMLKASWGGGGRGMRIIRSADELESQVNEGQREAANAFGKDEVYLEKMVERARHLEVQILGDTHGNIVHLFERDCSVQRRNQKVIERAPAAFLNDDERQALCDAAIKLAKSVNYSNAGTVEFLSDVDTGEFYFIEVNPRIQVEHTVTEVVTGIDIVKAQIRIAEGEEIGSDLSGVPKQHNIKLNGFAMQCRITTENPEDNFVPDYGRITAYRGATGFGIRLDGGTAYSGAVINRFYDSMLEKITTWAPDPDQAVDRMSRALKEFRIRGLATNLNFLENLIDHPTFRDGSYTTRFIDQTPELFDFKPRKDRATKILNYISEVTVNGNKEVKGRPLPRKGGPVPKAPIPSCDPIPEGSRDRFEKLGAKGFADWMLDQKQLLITDTTMRDAHQSLLATRMRSYDMVKIAPAYAEKMSDLLSLECWGGATFDVAMRFLNECPWERIREIRKAAPNILTQMLLRSSNGVGYTNYPDNVVKYFIEQTAETGVDIFRVFDSLNWVENMRVAMDAVIDTGKICEGTVCYTGDIDDPDRAKYSLNYYVNMAKELENAGAHIIGLKDMAGLLKPAAATRLVTALKNEISIPIHFHTHDTSGISAASVIAAAQAGVDAADAAMDSFSGLTSQPNLGSIVAALKATDRDTGLDNATIRELSDYWELVRRQYFAFESDIRSGASEVYLHEMPGGQFTNLKEQARSMGLEERWHEVAKAYADVNQMFGDIVKVTPSSKVVGDMAIMMVSSNLTRADVEDPGKDIAFPASVVSLMKGELGQSPGGFPEVLQAKVLKGEAPLTERPGKSMAPADLDTERVTAEKASGLNVNDQDLASYLMYPNVYTDFAKHRGEYGPVSHLPTDVFFYGMEPFQEIMVDLEAGKTLVIRCQAISDVHDDGTVEVFYELNGQPRVIKVKKRDASIAVKENQKAESGNDNHIGAPLPGMISNMAVTSGQKVSKGDLLMSIEAMKMETTIHAEKDGTVSEVLVRANDQVEAKDLLVVLK
ncbi:pyruvate carboxylase [Pseudemcibacter aquimaris]|uniref:pyruvate carboxylase n=1 Tax=Pseudemcibacter aquimaris TaxID=2857064 RepID=UPI002011AD9E|nr:pyruvate carboxylase [Pseudemcibacter aquimaris]MCC3859722.1 pyruvate carboxylase [Pseudemcibacter aquimaris]WDU60117.1 pyruvate carboxylase [Pseudemcibacter aquimaris]